mgnify:CR=1 FL=1
MNKFKFGDRVWHEKYGLCVITRSEPVQLYGIAHNHPTMAQIPWLISESDLTPATDWVKCSEWMPELDDVKSPCTEYFVATTSNDGDEVQRAYYIDWSSNERKWVSMNGIPIKAKVTHWMPSYTPAPPQD